VQKSYSESAKPRDTVVPEVSIIVPARNEEASLGACLESLLSQQDVSLELIVVNDHSTDRTAEIARSFTKVKVISAPALPDGCTGKNNAVAAGAQAVYRCRYGASPRFVAASAR